MPVMLLMVNMVKDHVRQTNKCAAALECCSPQDSQRTEILSDKALLPIAYDSSPPVAG